MNEPLTQPAGVRPPTYLVRVKVCGVTTKADALAVASAGADWVGLNFHPASRRFISVELAADLVAILPASVEPVGVFVNRPVAEVLDVASRVGLRTVQLHGDEPPEDLLALEALYIVRAFRLADAESVVKMEAYLARAERLGRAPDAVLIDAYVVGQPGGTGQAIGAEVLDRLPPLPRLILAGGLNAQNVAERIARVRPWMVDVAGGVESSPGRKDPLLVAAFIQAAKAGQDEDSAQTLKAQKG